MATPVDDDFIAPERLAWHYDVAAAVALGGAVKMVFLSGFLYDLLSSKGSTDAMRGRP
jgi:hypothetical protein